MRLGKQIEQEELVRNDSIKTIKAKYFSSRIKRKVRLKRIGTI